VADLAFFCLQVPSVALVFLFCHHLSSARALAISTDVPGLTAPTSAGQFAPEYFRCEPYLSMRRLESFSVTSGVQPLDVDSVLV